ncbi:tetratricopeptide repeat-containing sensor histidine kinase [Dyadobacter aurulentus]|uniref:tetratricopeptide repeat-containing sensor histidine kinase n=1 Tax=Dyadobacter sp. UC 10 TaxID=2605428 RepID=UPI0011F23C5D|nr:sensor histidine kinase [Dyadobacter sp. UC 10]KAA0993339.1 sensor histidine kinase [Dyadobacter sp. UC 10]
MKKDFFSLAQAKILQITLLSLSLLWSFSGCQNSPGNEQEKELEVWIDSLDRNSRKIGIKKSIMLLDSLMGTKEEKSFNERVQYYKFMKVLSHRDSTLQQDALNYTDSLLLLFSSVRVRELYPTDYSKALLLKGDDLFKQKEYYKAYRNYYHGKSFLTALGEICECARYSSRIANISYKEENYHRAIAYWEQELKELAECPKADNFQLEFIEVQGSIRNIGMAYVQLNKPDIASTYFQQAMDFIDKNESKFPREKNFIKFARLVILQNQAEAYALKGEVKIAERLLKKCLQHDPEIDWSVEVEQQSRLILTRIYIDTKQYDKAEEQLNILKTLPAASNNTATASMYQKLEAYILFGQEKFREAGGLLITSLKADEVSKMKKNGENKSDVGALLQQVQRAHETELTVAKDAQKELILRFSILISITLCVIIYLIWRSAKKSAANLRAVTELNKAITQSNIVLQDTVNALEQAEAENENVLKIVAHDLRSPIAAMISASHMVFWDQIPTSEQLEIVTAMQHSGEMANNLIGQILQSSSDREKISKSDAALQEIVQSCVDMLSHKAGEKQQKLEFQYEEVTAPVDREKIWRVFCNLLSNAIKFSPRESTILIHLQKQGDMVLLTVRDHGIGIPDELKSQIFLPSNEARRSGTAGEQSFGIGLSICRQIVEGHEGKIWFESESGLGTAFFVELPATATI